MISTRARDPVSTSVSSKPYRYTIAFFVRFPDGTSATKDLEIGRDSPLRNLSDTRLTSIVKAELIKILTKRQIEDLSIQVVSCRRLDGGAPIPIRMDTVYTNSSGEQRLVVSVTGTGKNAVVEWRTADPNLTRGCKAHGSVTIFNFRRWAVSMRDACQDDRSAFHEVQGKRRWRKEERRWVRAHRRP